MDYDTINVCIWDIIICGILTDYIIYYNIMYIIYIYIIMICNIYYKIYVEY